MLYYKVNFIHKPYANTPHLHLYDIEIKFCMSHDAVLHWNVRHVGAPL